MTTNQDTAIIPPKKLPETSYTVFNAVDAAVSKPVLGSDGAANWQDFRSSKNVGGSLMTKKKHSVAPTAPLKPADRAAGFTSWKDERKMEEDTRRETGERAMNSGYQYFKERQPDDDDMMISKKERQRILDRKIAPNQQYFIPSTTFKGWKMDYIFTTRPPRGTGYYFDGMDSLQKLINGEESSTAAAATTNTKPTSMLDASDTQAAVTGIIAIAESTPTAAATAAAAVEINKPSKHKSNHNKKRKHAATAVVILRDPTNPMEQVAAAVQRQKQKIVLNNEKNGWEMAIDPTSQRPYYYHRVSGQRSWELPNQKSVSLQNTVEWQEAKDSSTGKTYYYNSKTGVTQWEKPASMT